MNESISLHSLKIKSHEMLCYVDYGQCKIDYEMSLKIN